MTQKQVSKLETRIATLKQDKRIVWIEGIDAEVIKGKVAGKQVFFVKADSLNKNGGSWYYICKWATLGYECSCEYQGYKQCKHVPMVSEYNYQQHQREFRKFAAEMKTEREQAPTHEVGGKLPQETQQKVYNWHQSQSGDAMERLYNEAEENRRANVRYFYSEY